MEFRKKKPIGRLVKGRLTQPIEEKEVVAAHLIQEKVTRKRNTIEAQISDGGEILTSELQKYNFIFHYFTLLYRL